MANKSKPEIFQKSIRVRGLVQGVGFRPNVWRLANQSNLNGTVCNDGEGVLIEVWGQGADINNFQAALRTDIPPLARIDAIEVSEVSEVSDCPPTQTTSPDTFTIIASDTGKVTTTIIPDAATCDHCLADINDQTNRRYRYPFTNCTHCGPRLSITRDIPYDRANTSMAPFIMCPECQAEYEDPADRRFHAQPNACPQCGPKVWLCDKQGESLFQEGQGDVIWQAASLIKQGHILAIKGIGGFHLACDATNAEAVRTLRQRKKRYGKPLALMAGSIETIRQYAEVSDAAATTLNSASAPIVLLKKTAGAENLAPDIAPDQTTLGFMLAYTPLHHLLVTDANVPLVMTSGNVSNEPQVTGNDEALEKLSEIADYWLMHDRAIINRLDDSVVQLVNDETAHLRRARGFAPDTLILPSGFENTPNILALGADVKNTFCLIKDGKAMVSQHIGDLQDAGVHADFRKALDLYQAANDFVPQRIAVDMHPGYSSTRWGESISAKAGCPLDEIQHHHAHIAACLAENQFDINCPPVLGITFDGLGCGDDGTLWGGEFLIADYRSSRRVCGFTPVAIPGGEKASYEPWRNTFAHLHKALGWSYVTEKYPKLKLVHDLNQRPLARISKMIEQSVNSPSISSAGRLFDAVAGALDIFPDGLHFEGQAAMALQSAAENYPDETCAYKCLIDETISWQPMWEEILSDLDTGISTGRIAKRFHNTLSSAISEVVKRAVAEEGVDTVVLSGGVFQNKLLCEQTISELKPFELKVLYPKIFPANDGGVSLGQALISAARYLS